MTGVQTCALPIYNWTERLEDARELLLSRLSNYAKYEGLEIIVVFDAQLVPGIQQKIGRASCRERV